MKLNKIKFAFLGNWSLLCSFREETTTLKDNFQRKSPTFDTASRCSSFSKDEDDDDVRSPSFPRSDTEFERTTTATTLCVGETKNITEYMFGSPVSAKKNYN